MSDSLALAAVTSTLRTLLERGLQADDVLSSARVTVRPLDRARDTQITNQVNLFLYHTQPNATWRNEEVPWRVRPGETARTPLALDLYYLVTAFYGQDEDGVETTSVQDRLMGSHRLLGRAMGVLHDFSLLSMEQIHGLLPALDRTEHSYDQVERVRIRPQPMSLDDLSKLWGGFQTEYRPSAAYQVSVVLIESSEAPHTPLPVLRRGQSDRGAHVLGELAPLLRQAQPPGTKPAAELGDLLTLRGENLGGGGLTVRFRHPRLEAALDLAPEAEGTSTELGVQLPAAGDAGVPAAWPAGIYSLSLTVQRPDLPAWATNEVAFGLAPAITRTAPAGGTAPPGDVAVSLTCRPQVREEQRVALLFGNRMVEATSITTPADPNAPTTLLFLVPDVETGEYVLRLRVDGVDSIPVDFSGDLPQFDEGQKVTIES
ncbi:MAG: DUF4255 domain-containing protein [Anaerolineae bacterium]|jgi:hypothetical protein